ncbi:C40 family peptidase [Sulfuriflexus mobilis]|uniref:C40 family peptidase n=1 Tax=Sulfuriflexus mobilis TaxID=1811807 RepID=UPI000F829D12|nr:C40 family peptidase [Sulfuriflexus mobilis]
MTPWIPKNLLCLCLCLLLTACAGQAPLPEREPADRHYPGSAAQDLIRLSREQLGAPYRYGGNSPTRGFDCSGLVQYVHARSGLSVPRTTTAQFRRSRAVPLHAIRPGDLLFFRIDDEKPSHVGIYTGKGRFIHAPSSGKAVRRTRLNNPYWRSRLLGAGRFI